MLCNDKIIEIILRNLYGDQKSVLVKTREVEKLVKSEIVVGI